MDRGAWWATVHGVMKELDKPEQLNSNKPTLMDCGCPWGSSRVSTHLLLLSLFSHRVVSDSATPWTAACQAPLSSTISQSLLKFMSIESVMLSNHLILSYSLLLLPCIFPRVFPNDVALCIRWPKYWSFSISPSNEYSGLVFFRIDCFDLFAVQGTLDSLQHCNLKVSALQLYDRALKIMRNIF